MEKYIKALVPVLVFFFYQCVGYVGLLLYLFLAHDDVRQAIMNGGFDSPLFLKYQTPTVLGVYLIITGFLTALTLFALKMANSETAFSTRALKPKWLLVSIVAAISGIFATDIFSEWLDLPNLLEEQFTDMSSNVFGVISVALIGPIVEEIVFREAIIGQMVRSHVNPWAAIIFSSVCFGLIHVNPAQVPFAMIVGIILGIIYVKTGNIITTSLIHIINNGTSVALMCIYGQQANDMTLRDSLGLTTIPLMIVLALISVYLLRLIWTNYSVTPKY